MRTLRAPKKKHLPPVDSGVGFPTAVAAKLTGATIRTLSNWDARGVFHASIQDAGGHGVPRRYSFRDLVAIRVLREFTERGIPPLALRKVVAHLCAHKKLSPTEALASTNLVTDGHDVYEVHGETSISTLIRPGQCAFLVVALDELVADIQAKARTLRAA
jgi:DNA-binding transcriptional MerR regulator